VKVAVVLLMWTDANRCHRAVLAAGALLSLLACRPVVTVSWTEVAILTVVGLVLVGPLVLRLYRRLMDLLEGGVDENDPEPD
jgi:hypothetical protein